ncbi:MAG: helix-turn-helix domain-containing protein [Acidobacteria bacterium]|nr:helix-turn-helix domain-containing protein [Acidobacteriota bacterium]
MITKSATTRTHETYLVWFYTRHLKQSRIKVRTWFHGSPKPLTIADSATTVLGLQDEIRRSEEARYDHRLHKVLLVAQSMSCPQVARLLGDAPHSVQNWVWRFEEPGLGGLVEGERPGRRWRPGAQELQEINATLHRTPRDVGLTGTL